MDKETLEKYLQEKLGESFEEGLLDELDFETEEETEEEEEEKKSIFDEEEDEETEDEDEIEEEDGDNEFNINDINLDAIEDPTMKVLAQTLINQQKKAEKREIDIAIRDAKLPETSTKFLKGLVKRGAKIEDIEMQIEHLSEVTKQKERAVRGAQDIYAKRTVGSKGKKLSQKKTPKVGTKDFGAMIAEGKY
jgi:hypothetical protein